MNKIIWDDILVFDTVFKQPLFIITGASCIGKPALCNELFINESNGTVPYPAALLGNPGILPAQIAGNWIMEKIL